MTSRRILMLSSQFLPEVFGGAEQQCLRLSRALAARGHRPHILTSRCDPATPAEEVLHGVPVTRLIAPAPPQIGGPHLGATLHFARAVARWMDSRDGFDIIHCHQAKLNALIGVREAVRRGLPSLVKPGSAGENFDLARLQRKRYLYGRFAARYVAQRADALVAISDEMQRDLLAFGVPRSRCHSIPNGVPIPSGDPAERQARRESIRRRLAIAPKERVVLFVGRMEHQKNVDTLLRAMALLPSAPPLILLGDGSLLNAHKALAGQLGLSGRVRFLGRVEVVGDHLSAADFLALPAVAEGMSNALLEAMAVGVIPLASRVSGNVDIVDDGVTGWLYGPAVDQERLADLLRRALTCSDDRLAGMAGAARLAIRDRFSIDAVAARYEALYGQLCSAATSTEEVAA